MKLLNVFGLVVGAHLAALTIIFAVPGCRSSSGKPKPASDTMAAADEAVPVSPVALTTDDLNAPEAVPVVPLAVSSVRQAPTRPEAAPLPPPPPPTPMAPRATYTVAKGDSLWTIARKHGVTVAELAAANQLSPSATLRVGQTISVPAASVETVAAPGTDAANLYEVKAGDMLGTIARRQGTTVAALRSANNLSNDNLRVGQKLVIPGNAVPPADLATRPSATSSAPAPVAGPGTYVVVAGDTLGGIARRVGAKVGDLATLNTITDPAKLRVGQVLRLPSGASAPAPAAAPVPPSAATPVEAAPAPTEPAPTAVTPVAIPVIRID